MYTAMILMCISNEAVNINNCMVMQSNILYESEDSCVVAVAELLNSEMFKYAYGDYKLDNFLCYEWLDPSEIKI